MNINLAIKKILRLAGLEVRRHNFLSAEAPLLRKLISDYQIRTVLDVGANEGQYAMQLINNGYSGEIYSFEPLTEPYSKLARRSSATKRWKAIQCAIGSKEEDKVINISENIVSSSLYQVGQNSVSVEPASKIVGREIVKVICLDSFLETLPQIQNEVLLKLDVQGFELEALKGSSKHLRQMRIIQTELSLVPLYERAPLFSKVVTFLQDNGFEIFTILPGFRDNKTGRLLQVDGVFVKRED